MIIEKQNQNRKSHNAHEIANSIFHVEAPTPKQTRRDGAASRN